MQVKNPTASASQASAADTQQPPQNQSERKQALLNHIAAQQELLETLTAKHAASNAALQAAKEQTKPQQAAKQTESTLQKQQEVHQFDRIQLPSEKLKDGLLLAGHPATASVGDPLGVNAPDAAKLPGSLQPDLSAPDDKKTSR